MRKFAILLLMIISAFVLSDYVRAQEGDGSPVESNEIEDEMMMFADEAMTEVGGPEATQAEETETTSDEIVTTYDEDENTSETDDCTLWSCALFKMIVAVTAIGASAFWVFMLADVIRLDPGVFPAGRSYRRWLWFAGILTFWAIGAAIYYFEIFRRKSK